MKHDDVEPAQQSRGALSKPQKILRMLIISTAVRHGWRSGEWFDHEFNVQRVRAGSLLVGIPLTNSGTNGPPLVLNQPKPGVRVSQTHQAQARNTKGGSRPRGTSTIKNAQIAPQLSELIWQIRPEYCGCSTNLAVILQPKSTSFSSRLGCARTIP